ncbi:Gfo/Idh/MocA family oxidoreductase [Bacillus sp. NEB1478]|uniref:Gfo/Idh/MocA family protein n=1 Tax=Bacillus sp. NEB1478 TaxID=3073816 RepID=UPI002873496E|nr:Gfo/Idh/MocA family oxidoreductase [Bacillus sp. NEB1478]WNB91036.1 Gfo/Idh/MocA family oxidoreductase [Bacillus sp. NEB1478]
MNVALISKWHVHAVDYAREAQENESISIKQVWDEDSLRGKQWAQELGVPFEADLEAVLSNPEIDGIIITTPTNLHKEVIIAAANHGKHIFTEKVLAFSVEDCEEIFSAVEKNNVHLMLSLPRLTESFYLYAQNVVDQGLLGDITNVRCRVAHNGAVPSDENGKGWLPDHFFDKEACGGGALIDLGAHPIYLTNRLGGKVKSVSGKLSRFHNREVDDNAVVMVEYESGAIGLIETGFLSFGSPQQLELYGTEGTLLIEDKVARIKSKHLGTGEWVTPEFPEPKSSAIQQWVDSVENGKQPFITKEDMYNLTVINEAAALSNEEGRHVLISEITKFPIV